jgi:hypothetical protein
MGAVAPKKSPKFDNFALLGKEWYFLTDVSGKTIGSETSVRNYHYSLRNSPEERISGVLCVESLNLSKQMA